MNRDEGGLNLYGYVENNSVNAVDPIGWYTLDSAAAGQIESYLQGTRQAIKVVNYLHQNSDSIGVLDYKEALKAAGLATAGIAGIGATNSSGRAAAISEAINSIERDALRTAERHASVYAGLAFDGLYKLLTLGSMSPNSGMYYYTLGELNAHNALLEQLLIIESQLADAGLLSKCP